MWEFYTKDDEDRHYAAEILREESTDSIHIDGKWIKILKLYRNFRKVYHYQRGELSNEMDARDQEIYKDIIRRYND